MKPFIHSLADVQSDFIGDDTRIWQFVIVLREARIGCKCNLCANVFIENDVVVGNNVTIKCGVQLWDGVRIGDNVFIGPNVTFCNDKYPVSGKRDIKFLRTVVDDDVSIGANATILPGIHIGRGAVIGAGAVVVKDIPEGVTVVGNPAKEIKND